MVLECRPLAAGPLESTGSIGKIEHRVVAPTTGPEFDAFVAAEIRKWGRAVKVSGAKPE